MIRFFTIELDGTTQQLAEECGLTDDKDVPIKALILQPHDGNSAVIYVGDADVDANNYGFRLEAPAAGIPPAPFIMGEVSNSIGRLSQVYVVGTTSEYLCVTVIT